MKNRQVVGVELRANTVAGAIAILGGAHREKDA
jgi:hypothetical protein